MPKVKLAASFVCFVIGILPGAGLVSRIIMLANFASKSRIFFYALAHVFLREMCQNRLETAAVAHSRTVIEDQSKKLNELFRTLWIYRKS